MRLSDKSYDFKIINKYCIDNKLISENEIIYYIDFGFTINYRYQYDIAVRAKNFSQAYGTGCYNRYVLINEKEIKHLKRKEKLKKINAI